MWFHSSLFFNLILFRWSRRLFEHSTVCIYEPNDIQCRRDIEKNMGMFLFFYVFFCSHVQAKVYALESSESHHMRLCRVLIDIYISRRRIWFCHLPLFLSRSCLILTVVDSIHFQWYTQHILFCIADRST